MFCPKCGSKTAETDKFCGVCGADLRQKKANNQEPHVDSSPVKSNAHVFSTIIESASDKPNAAEFSLATSAPVVSTFAGSAPIAESAIQDSESPSKKKIGNLNALIGIVAIIILGLIVAICAYLFFFSAKPCYVVKKSVNDLSDVSSSVSYDRDENGMIVKATYTNDGKSQTYSYKELAEGLSIEEGDIGEYDRNSDGYLSRIEVTDSSGKLKYTRVYEYYSPGMIKSVEQRDAQGVITTTIYNEDGWWTSSKTTDSDGKVSELTCVYTFSKDGRSVTAKRTGSGNAKTKESTCVYDLDENGNVVAMYYEGQSSSRVSYMLEKIDRADKMVAATARLKQ